MKPGANDPTVIELAESVRKGERKAVEILDPFPVAGAPELLEVAIAHSVNCAFHTAPQLQPGLLLEYHGS